MKSLLSAGALLVFCISLCAQKKQDFIQLRDKRGNAVTSTKDAYYFTRIHFINDTCWQFQDYEVIGPMVSSRQFKDPNGIVAHGRSCFMRPDGTLDSTGHFVNGKPDGEWLYFDSTGSLVTKKEYVFGILVNILHADSRQDSTGYFYFVEARLRGANNAWTNYLATNLRYPPNAFTNRVNGNVEVYFMIDTAGRVQDPVLLRSSEFTLDDEALRVVRESPQWVAATQNGARVDSYVQQRIQFKERVLATNYTNSHE